MKKKKRTLLIFGAQNVQWRRVSNSRERSSNFSLDFLTFGSSDRVGPRSKVVLRGEGYAWAPILGSFDKSKR